MSNIYFYPKIDYQIAESPNPYIAHFEEAISRNHKIVNQRHNKKGVLDFFLHFFSTEIFIFNWIEDLPFYRFGKIQVFFFISFIGFTKIFRKRMVWVLHNKYTHDKENNYWTDLMFNLMMKYSDLILTHSSEGIAFAKEYFPKYAKKVKYLIHPMNPLFPIDQEEVKKIDLLIWGTVARYKGISPFLEYLKQLDPSPHLKIKIVGRCFQDDYRAELQTYLSPDIQFIEALFDLEEISRMAQQARFILFTHKQTSVLSSGALMDSLRMGTPIIGPDFGSFHDLSKKDLVCTYQTYKDIIDLCSGTLTCSTANATEIQQFYRENSWEQFGKNLDQAFIILKNKKLTSDYVWN